MRWLVAFFAIDNAFAPNRDDVSDTCELQELDRRSTRGAGPSRDDDPHVAQIFAHDCCGVDQRRKYDDRSAVLIVMHHRDVERFDQPAFDFEAARCGDIFEIDAAENRGDAYDGLDYLVDVFRIETHRPRVDLSELFEEHALAFHDGCSSKRTDIAKTEYCGAVGNDGNGVAFDRQLKRFARIRSDRHRHARDTRRVHCRKIGTRFHRNLRLDGYLAAEVGEKRAI